MLDLTKHPEPWRAASGPGGALDVVDGSGVTIACDVPPAVARAVALLPTLLALLGRVRKLLSNKLVITPNGTDPERRNILQALGGLLNKEGG